MPVICGAGLSVDMANAVEPVRAAANRGETCPDNDGLAEVVGWLRD